MPEVNHSNLVDSQGNIKTVQIQLIESAGPVSPAYQYNLEIVLKNEGPTLHLKYSYQANFIAGVPEEKKSIDEKIPKEISLKILESLLKMNPTGINIPLSEDVKNNVGVSFNEFSLEIGDYGKSNIHFTLNQLKKPEFAHSNQIIEFIKNLDKWKTL